MSKMQKMQKIHDARTLRAKKNVVEVVKLRKRYGFISEVKGLKQS